MSPMPFRIAPRVFAALALVPLLAACAGMPSSRGTPDHAIAGARTMFSAERDTVHRDGDDLLTAGLGLSLIHI